ncbi:MAG: DNA primase, partial [Polyangiales bacterium]
MIPDEKIAEIRERTDIVGLVGEHVRLKRAGASFKGLCPFHSEKTPSFHVHPSRQFFHCFGCHTSGDVFSFLQQLEGRAFPEIARDLAERAGVELEVLDPKEEQRYRRERQRIERLTSLMDAAAGFYVKQLREHPLGKMAREELERRNITMETAEAFRLGYAPHGWDALLAFLRQGGWSPQDAEEVGLIVPRRSGDGHYDRFRHRLLFPITDVHGRIVAFSGRQLDPPPGVDESDQGPAKYVNSPEGPLYKKGEILFGLHEGRVTVRREGWVVVCEGNFDLVALHQAGFENAVAPMGTALTERHVKLLRRFAERVVLLFDGDSAGRRAVREAHPLLQKAGLAAQVVVLPPGDDPDSFLRERGADALRERVDTAPGLVDFMIDDAASEAAGDAHAKAKGVEQLGPVLAVVDNPVERRLYVERVAQRFGIADIEAVRQQLNRGYRQAKASERGPRKRPDP